MKGVQLVNALAEFWGDRSYFSEVFSWVEKAEEESRTQAGTPVRATALYYYGRYIYYGRYDNILFRDWKKAQPIWEESLETFRDLGDAHQIEHAVTQLLLGLFLYIENNEHEKGYTYIQEAIHLIKNTGNNPRYAWALGALYDVKLYEDDFNTAIVLEEEAMKMRIE